MKPAVLLKLLFVTIIALVISGCAIDRSQLATPEALRNLPPPPAVPEGNPCYGIPDDAGASSPATEKMEFDGAESVLADDKDYIACFVTNKGIIEATLFDDDAPETVNNFVFLAQQGFYDGVLWHRVVDDFVIQGGDRNGAIDGRPGTGGPGYQWDDEAAALALEHANAGTLSMANAGPNTNGSQFFITHTDTPHLNGLHAVFGEVIGERDMDIVLSIAQNDLIQTIQIIEVDES